MAARLGGLAQRAMLLEREVYLEAKAAVGTAREGVGFVLTLGLALGVMRAAGAAVAWSAAPESAALRRVLLEAVERAPLLQQINGGDRWAASLASWEPLWRLLAWSAPPPLLALMLMPAAPLGLLAAWLSFGLAGHSLAQRLGGQGRLPGGLHCLALAEAPRAILLVPILSPLWPPLIAAEAWVLTARYQALKAAYGLQGWAAFWATLAAEVVSLAALALVSAAALLALPVWRGAL
ncbi:MAG: hypothetical protein ACUVX9_01870 [Anaerolineae bacterium]